MKTPGFRAIAAFHCLLFAAAAAYGQQPSRIAGRLDSARRFALAGRVHRKATPQNDLGRVAGAFEMPGVTLVLRPSAEGQAALTKFLQEQQDPASANYQRALTPDEYGVRFGANESDLQQITDWLKSQGLTADVARGRNWITINGTADQVGKAFGTEIHRYQVDGETHFANATNPTVPAPLSGLVADITGLHDFHMKPRLKKPSPMLNVGSVHHLAPDDIAAIYNIAPLYQAGIDGTGMSIAIVGQTAIRTTDIDNFRSHFGLPTINLQQVQACGRRCPGIISGDVDEAHLDIEWSGAVARNATIYYVYSNDVWTSAMYAVNQNVAKVISMSYGLCEQADFVNLPAYQQVAQQAAAQGISWFAASGDNGAGDCEDFGVAVAQAGLAVDVPASLPEVTGVGGTTLSEQGGEWASTNTANLASALSYIRERVWNDSTFGELSGGGGGNSLLFPRPAWQTGPGVPNDSVRHVPDVSFASSPNHDSYYIYSAGTTYAGGTSFAAPVMAGIAALLNHYLVSTGAIAQPGLGNLNPTLYRMAQTTTGVFHDVVDGDNAVPCAPNTPDCVNGSFGMKAGPGYDSATGLGSVDAFNLVKQWSSRPAISSAVVPSIDHNPVFQTNGVWRFGLTLSEQAGIGTKLTDFTVDGVSHASEIAAIFGSANIQPRGSASGTMVLNSVAAPKNVVFGFKGTDTSGPPWSTEFSVPFHGPQVPLTSAGFSNAASGQQVFAPGMIMSVYGTGLGNFAQSAGAIPLPTFLAGFVAYINGTPAPLYYVSPNQVNVQIPYETTPGRATLDISNPFDQVSYNFTVAATGPGVFTFQDGFVNPSRAARRGDVATLFITGEGAVTPSLATGDTPPASTSLSRLPRPRAAVSITVGGVPVVQDSAWFVGIPSGLVGVTQINFRIPTTVQPGTQDVVVTVGANVANTAKITVQ
jgi:uncharacterized protein (TIGR03437 family)